MTSLMTSSAAEIYKNNWTEIIIKLMRRSKAYNAGQAIGHTAGI